MRLTSINKDGKWETIEQNRPVLYGVHMRTKEQTEECLKICSSCDKLTKDKKCRMCKICGGFRTVDGWVKLSSHDCPLKKWPVLPK